MARDAKSRPASRPTSLTAIAQTYHGCAAAFAASLGIPLAEALRAYHGPITALFIEACRQEVRVAAGVTLPPLAASTPVATANGQRASAVALARDDPATAALPNGRAIPTAIPADSTLPCAGQEIALLTPPQLAMLLAKTARLLHDGDHDWTQLHHALQNERARLEGGLAQP